MNIAHRVGAADAERLNAWLAALSPDTDNQTRHVGRSARDFRAGKKRRGAHVRSVADVRR